MNALLINGSPNAAGCTFTALTEVAGELENAGIATEIFQIGHTAIRGCQACYACRQPESTGYCIFKDDIVNGLIDKIRAADAIVLGSPVYYAALSGQLKALLDRAFFAGRFSHKLGAAVVSCRRGGASSAFDQLNHYFTISNIHIVSSNYWNQVHGTTPDEVRQDLEGLQTMRALGKNMAWLLKCIDAGKNAGIELLVHEDKIATNFIR
ncbi:MAG: flavodoxin family protein [Kiritimatiellales bacterium]